MAEVVSVVSDRADRAVGALLGVLIGDALGFGYQWYYDLQEKEKDYGPFVKDYVDPKPDARHSFAYVHKYRHEQGLRAGDTSQNGEVHNALHVVQNYHLDCF